ncbi:MAG: hypothetical protein ACOY3Y_09525 [Acidobacteriota bacterium]
MRVLATALMALVAAAATAEVVTVEGLLAAHSYGAPAEKMLEKINDPANTVAPISPDGLAKLRAAGVPEVVVQALAARAPQPTPTPVGAQPDDARLTLLVQALKHGVSESVLLEQIRNTADRFPLSLNDLIYLKQSNVPEAIVTALQKAGSGAVQARSGVAPALAPTKAPEETTIEGLSMVRSTFLRKNRQGTLMFKGDEIAWTDAADSLENFTVKTSAIERAWLKCRPLPAGNFCHELGFAIFKGEEYSFLDVEEGKGSNANLLRLREAIAKRLPNLVFEERIKK